jgi:hypothetical protein
MEPGQPTLTLTPAQWREKERRGQVAMIDNRPFIVLTNEATRTPVYQRVIILDAEAQR